MYVFMYAYGELSLEVLLEAILEVLASEDLGCHLGPILGGHFGWAPSWSHLGGPVGLLGCLRDGVQGCLVGGAYIDLTRRRVLGAHPGGGTEREKEKQQRYSISASRQA